MTLFMMLEKSVDIPLFFIKAVRRTNKKPSAVTHGSMEYNPESIS